jgi:translocator protein
MDKKYIKLGVLVSTLGMLFTNFLSNYLPFNNLTTQEISDSIPTYFTPAGYVFAIWGIIYIGLLIYNIIIFKQKDSFNSKAAVWVIVSNIANSLWLLLWHYQYIELSVLVMLVLLFSLIIVFTQLSKPKSPLLLTAPFSIYLGWISVATIANIAAALYVSDIQDYGLSEEMWSIIMIATATGISLVFSRTKKDPFFSLVILWAVIGILYRYLAVSDLIVGGSLVAAIIILFDLVLLSLFTKKESYIHP